MDYLAVNKASWNQRTKPHLESEFYDVAGFLKGRCSLNSIELDLLGNIEGKSILHLQCHFGQDSISLARRGAKVTAIDFSDEAIRAGKELNEKCGTDVEFIECDLYSLPNHLDKKFDIVFSSFGTIIWLPDLDKWAKVVSQFLKPQGQFVFAEFHPVLWMYDDDFTKIQYNYFNDGAIAETEEGTYTDGEKMDLNIVTWNHSLAEVMMALIQQNLRLEVFQEFDYSPYNCTPAMITIEKGINRIKDQENYVPLVYGLKMSRV